MKRVKELLLDPVENEKEKQNYNLNLLIDSSNVLKFILRFAALCSGGYDVTLHHMYEGGGTHPLTVPGSLTKAVIATTSASCAQGD